MKLLMRSMAFCDDDPNVESGGYPLESSLSSSSAFISDSIFPSPYPISREEALRETSGLANNLQGENAKPNDARSSEQAEAHILANSDGQNPDTNLSENAESTASDGDAVSSSKLGNVPGPNRRETEKPPRMQKQRSQDRLLLKHQKNSFDSDHKRDNLSRASSDECVDSTGVPVQEFLVNTLRSSTRDRAILLKMEQDMTAFINDNKIDFLKFPPMTSYHRMLVHRVAAFFGMDHNVDETGKAVIINKTSCTRLPDMRFADQFDPNQCEPHSGRRDEDIRRSILKRTNQSRSFDRDDKRGGSWKDQQKSIEEREEAYEKVRARIFNNPEVNMSGPVYSRRTHVSAMATARMMAYSDRPWNSHDLEQGMRIPNHAPLTTRASSYSGISVLPRHNATNGVKTGSSSSVSSINGGAQGYSGKSRHANMLPRPPTPNRRNGMNEGSSGAFYYMQPPQNQGLPYLSPEGYQLVYQSGPPGGATMSNSQYARYYQMPPQHSHGMGYPHGNVYDDSAQKGQGPGNTDYAVIPPNYPHSMAATTTVYSGVQGQPNMNYAYQPAVFRPPSDPSMAINSTPAMQSGPPQQGKQTPVMQANPNYVQATVPGANFPPPYIAGPAGNVAAAHPGLKEAMPPGNAPGAQKNAMPQAVPVMHPAYQQQAAYAQAMQKAAVPPGNDKYPQKVLSKDPLQSSGSSQDSKKNTEDELAEKMNAIVLKNLQQQQQVSEGPNLEARNTVTNARSPSVNQASNPVVKPAHDSPQGRVVEPHSRTQHKSPAYPYQYSNGMPQQQQQMQVYVMPSNTPTGNASYQGYPQYMTQPQPPHVVGPGMHFVYLSPPVVGMDGSGNVQAPSNMHVYHPGQVQPQHMPAAHQPYPGARGYAANTNNNNAVSATAQDRRYYVGSNSKQESEVGTSKDDKTFDKATSRAEVADTDNVADKTSADSITSPSSEAVADQAVDATSTVLGRPAYAGQPVASNQVYVSHNHVAQPGHGPPFLVGNYAQDYRMAGMNMTGPVTYPTSVIPKYPIYPNMPAQYMYLPGAGSPRGSKLPEMKTYQGQAPQTHSPGLVAVQLPNQNSIQLVPAPSIQHQNAVYYAAPNYVTADYSYQSQVPPPNHIPANEARHESSLQEIGDADGDNAAECDDADPAVKETDEARKDETAVGDDQSVAEKQ